MGGIYGNGTLNRRVNLFLLKLTIAGEAAYNQAPRNPENTVHDSKRLIGREFNDPVVQVCLKLI